MRQLLTNRMVKFFSTKNAKDHYGVLGVHKQASQEEIKAAYYKLAKQYHPDLHPQFSQKFKQVNQAYNFLKDPTKKADYDGLYKMAKDKVNVEGVSRSYYNTHYHYGYTQKFKKQAQSRHNYESNPFASQYQKSFSTQFTRDMFKKEDEALRTNNLKKMNSNVKNTLIIIFSFVTILLLTEIMLDLYKFNHDKQKTIPQGRSKDVY